MTAPVFVVDKVPVGGEFVLDGAEGRHAVSVKRLRADEEVTLTDGAGNRADAVVVAAEGKDRLVVRVTAYATEEEPAVRITVVQALPKGDRGEVAVETMTETGVDAIVPWQAARCITQWKGERGAKALTKWRSTAREAGKQSRRVRFPEVTEAMTTKQYQKARAVLKSLIQGLDPETGAELPKDTIVNRIEITDRCMLQ